MQHYSENNELLIFIEINDMHFDISHRLKNYIKNFQLIYKIIKKNNKKKNNMKNYIIIVKIDRKIIIFLIKKIV